MKRACAFLIALWMLGTASAVGIAWLAAGIGSLRIGEWTILSWSQIGNDRRVGGWNVQSAADWSRRAWRVVPSTTSFARPEPYPALAPPPWSRAWREPTPAESERVWFESEFGWPVRWLIATCEDARFGRLVDRADLIEHGVAIKPLWLDSLSTELGGGVEVSMTENPVQLAALPTGVRWVQGAASIAFWSGAWFIALALCAGPKRLAQHLRSKRGRCRFCRHALSPGGEHGQVMCRCPECGRSEHERVPIASRALLIGTWCMAFATTAAVLAWALFISARYEPPPLLHRDASHGDTATIDRELARGVPVDQTDQGGFRLPATALMYAASAGQSEAVKRLLTAGASPNAPLEYFDLNSTGLPPLVWAAMGGSTVALRAIADAGAAFDPELRSFAGRKIGEVAIGRACNAGQRDAVAWLIERDPEVCLPTELFWWGGRSEAIDASSSGRDPEILRMVLDAYEKRFGSREALCGKLAKDWSSAYHKTGFSGRIENLRILVARCPCELCLSTVADAALSFGHSEFVLSLLGDGAQLNDPEVPLLATSLRVGMRDLLPNLLEAGADPNASWRGNGHALAEALRQNDVESARLLIRAGAVLDRHPTTWCDVLGAIDWPTTTDEMIELLLDRLPAVDHTTESKQTALMAATRAASERWVKRLLERGADPRTVDADGRSVRDYAATPDARGADDCLQWWNAPDDKAADDAARRAVIELIDRALERDAPNTATPGAPNSTTPDAPPER